MTTGDINLTNPTLIWSVDLFPPSGPGHAAGQGLGPGQHYHSPYIPVSGVFSVGAYASGAAGHITLGVYQASGQTPATSSTETTVPSSGGSAILTKKIDGAYKYVRVTYTPTTTGPTVTAPIHVALLALPAVTVTNLVVRRTETPEAGGVDSLVAGDGIELTPSNGKGNVTVTASGAGGYNSLTGAGQSTDTGELTQGGNFTIDGDASIAGSDKTLGFFGQTTPQPRIAVEANVGVPGAALLALAAALGEVEGTGYGLITVAELDTTGPLSIALTITTGTATPEREAPYAVETISGVTAALTIENPSGTAHNGDQIVLRIAAGGTHAITWESAYLSSGVATLPTTTVKTSTITVGLQYDSTAAKWVCLAVDKVGYTT